MNGRPGPRLAPALALGLALLASPAGAAWGAPTEKEAFLLMFGKGNGAMRLLCALERDGLISATTRRRYSERLEQLVGEPADSDIDRRNVRVGMAFAAGRPSLCLPTQQADAPEAGK
ncbi:MAG: hypothetical protein FJ054_02805 [Cyanobacteria bacterium M_surface_10_m2_119]|nr:hypothetical protein [Cyanobacteria bacterium M_surface_10_m2_119]